MMEHMARALCVAASEQCQGSVLEGNASFTRITGWQHVQMMKKNKHEGDCAAVD
jgi:hypothetical protein